MKRLALAAPLALVVAVVFLWPEPGSGPEPIVYGRDACAHCRMYISRPGFAGEIRDRDGVLTKYDDIGCLLHAMLEMRGALPEVWVEDHRTGELISLLEATLVYGEGIDTPMGFGIVALADDADAGALAAERGGTLVTLDDVLGDPARFLSDRGRRAGQGDRKG